MIAHRKPLLSVPIVGVPAICTSHHGGIAVRPIYSLVFLPAAALLATPVLPFVNRPALWFGLPSVVVWVTVWCLAAVAVMLLIDRTISAREAASGFDVEPAEEASP
ncbi:hypothetical protein FB384_003406 [Prauserella sediminis]|uniref:DUF3311 domain-containing protein n=1 Tax=Prauserella sediminis TaxID=577680 RepID=A0A839XKR4_9PSEU|nr:hypothetical protein [Prauserella sediminis]MBB3664502.1 hypothetical protein [Prauserella sediminis]